MKQFLLIFFILLGAGWVEAQTSISGQVLDAKTGEPLIGATVLLHELDNGTITDIEGKFLFDELKPANYHLHISFIGYVAESITIATIGMFVGLMNR